MLQDDWSHQKSVCKSSRFALMRICKTFIRPHLDYGYFIYDKPNNESIKNKIENVQYNACHWITGDIPGTALDYELG